MSMYTFIIIRRARQKAREKVIASQKVQQATGLTQEQLKKLDNKTLDAYYRKFFNPPKHYTSNTYAGDVRGKTKSGDKINIDAIWKDFYTQKQQQKKTGQPIILDYSKHIKNPQKDRENLQKMTIYMKNLANYNIQLSQFFQQLQQTTQQKNPQAITLQTIPTGTYQQYKPYMPSPLNPLNIDYNTRKLLAKNKITDQLATIWEEIGLGIRDTTKGTIMLFNPLTLPQRYQQ